MILDGARIRQTRAGKVRFSPDPDRSNPHWWWSPGLVYVLDVDQPPVFPKVKTRLTPGEWKLEARANGESWITRSTEACRAVLMRAGRQKHPLISTTLYVSLPTRLGALLEQPTHIYAVIEEGDWFVWTAREDHVSSENISHPRRGS